MYKFKSHFPVWVQKEKILRFFSVYNQTLVCITGISSHIVTLWTTREEEPVTLTRNDFAVSNNGNGTLYVYEATDEKKTKNIRTYK